MQKIGDITDTADGNGEFTDGNVAGNVMPTELMAAWFTTMQREIIAVLTEAKIQPDKADDAQLLAAIKIILTKGIDGSGFLLAKNNFSDVEDNALSRGHLGLKSAAIQDVVISMTDSTAGRVPVVGWMGLGGLTPAVGSDNLTCFYHGGVGAATNPLNDRGFAFVNLAVSGSYRCRLALDYTHAAPRIFYQNILDKTYNPYVEFYTTARKPTANDVGAIPFFGGISTGTNLNTLTDPGIWFNSANANATLALNYPSTQAGSLQVLQDAGVTQVYTEYSSGAGRQWRRGLYSGVWSAWRAVYDSMNKPTPDDVNAIMRDGCHIAGFVSGDVAKPYMRHSASNAVVQLLPITTADNRYIQNTQMGAEEYEDIPYPGQASLPWGACITVIVGTTKSTGSGISFHISRVYFRRLQKYIGGTWKNFA